MNCKSEDEVLKIRCFHMKYRQKTHNIYILEQIFNFEKKNMVTYPVFA